MVLNLLAFTLFITRYLTQLLKVSEILMGDSFLEQFYSKFFFRKINLGLSADTR